MLQENKSPPKGAVLTKIFDHQRWLASNRKFGKRLDHEGLLIKDCNLDGVDLSQAILDYAVFERVSLRGARFIGAFLTDATFDSCDLAGTDFSYAHAYFATFVASNHRHACFDGVDLDRIAWSREEFGQMLKLSDQDETQRFARERSKLTLKNLLASRLD